MRTTVTLDPDVAAAIDQLRAERSAGLSLVLNDLVRRGLAAGENVQPFRQDTSPMRARLDVSNVADVLETLDDGGNP